jgi:hypothetical protein
METRLNVSLTFPSDIDTDTNFKKLRKYFDSIESIESCFGIEFSCGDGLYLSDIEDDEVLLDKYDGEVCTDSMPRHQVDGIEFKPGKKYRFTIKYLETDEALVFYLNDKETFRKPSY